MRYLIALTLILALPAFAQAQQAGDATDASATVQLEQSVTPDDANFTPVTTGSDTDTEQATDAADGTVDAAVVQEPASRSWWYIVGAVVVGGLIVALLL